MDWCKEFQSRSPANLKPPVDMERFTRSRAVGDDLGIIFVAYEVVMVKKIMYMIVCCVVCRTVLENNLHRL